MMIIPICFIVAISLVLSTPLISATIITSDFVKERFGIPGLVDDNELNWFSDFLTVDDPEVVNLSLNHAIMKHEMFPKNRRLLFRFLLRSIPVNDRSVDNPLFDFFNNFHSEFFEELVEYFIEIDSKDEFFISFFNKLTEDSRITFMKTFRNHPLSIIRCSYKH